MAENMEYTDEEVEDVFEEATTLIMSSKIPMPDEQLLIFYGLYKQATVGKCDTDKPGFFDFKGKAKWDAWNKLGNMSQVDAMKRYSEEVHRVVPSWDPWKNRALDKSGKKGTMAPVVSRMLEEQEDDPVTICDFAASGDIDRVRELLEKGVDPNFVDENRFTALHMAADRGYLEIVQLLINSGSNVNARDINDDTPLHNACLCSHKEVITLLLNNGADRTIKNSSGETPADHFDLSSL